MKTVIITSFHSLISRNILSTRIPALLVESGVRIVLVVPRHKARYYTETFGGPSILVEGVDVNLPTRHLFGRLFKRVSWHMLSSETVATRQKRLRDVDKKFFRYWALYLSLRVLSRVPFAVRCIRYLDARLSPRDLFSDVFDRHNPDLVFATDIQNENDVALLVEAAGRTIPTAAMVRSWDNLSQWGMIRVVPRMLIVPNVVAAEEARRLHFVPAERIVVSGIPHYDRYRSGPYEDRETFLLSLGLDPAKKTILHAPIGNFYVNDVDIDRLIIDTLARTGHNVIVRFPPFDTVSNVANVDAPNVYINKPGISFGQRGFFDNEITDADDRFLMNALYQSDVVTTGPSTFAIDAALFDKPIVLIHFYAAAKTHWDTLYYYDFTHVRRLLQSGGVRVAESKDAFLDLVARYLANPELDREGREYLVRTHCGPSDARASERVAQALIALLG